MLIKRGWWKSVAVLCLILQVGFLAAGLLHFALSGKCEHRHDEPDHACPGFPHVHVAAPDEAGSEFGPHPHHQSQTVAIAGANHVSQWAPSGKVFPCPSEHCLICSLSDLVRSSDITPAGEPVLYIRSARCTEHVPDVDISRSVFRPCLPRGPPIVS